MQYGIAFAPLVPLMVLWIALAATFVIAALLFVGRARGAAVRVAGARTRSPCARQSPRSRGRSVNLLLPWPPSLSTRVPAKTLASAPAKPRRRVRRSSTASSRSRALRFGVVEAGQADGETDGTKLFSALSSALSDVPTDRVAGALLITDGRVHDIPANAAALGFTAPVHALITGRKDELRPPNCDIGGSAFRHRRTNPDHHLSPRRSGRKWATRESRRASRWRRHQRTHRAERPDRQHRIDIKHAGPNIVEIEASPLENELTLVNNRAVVAIDGVRDKLRVLLVSGEPHSGERTWRNLLKSDASVDLVHFTILRPPEKQDGTPINELSLIAFPTRELFSTAGRSTNSIDHLRPLRAPGRAADALFR